MLPISNVLNLLELVGSELKKTLPESIYKVTLRCLINEGSEGEGGGGGGGVKINGRVGYIFKN